MNVMRLEVRRGQNTALITRDRMRVDLITEFFLRVAPSREAVALAAQTLGRRAMQPDGIRAVSVTVEGVLAPKDPSSPLHPDNVAEALFAAAHQDEDGWRTELVHPA